MPPLNWLVPDLVVVMNWPAVEWPNSAANWLVMSWNSCTESWMGTAIAPFTSPLLLSRPSTTKLLFRGRFPPMVPPCPATPPDCVPTPGARTAKFVTSPLWLGS